MSIGPIKETGNQNPYIRLPRSAADNGSAGNSGAEIEISDSFNPISHPDQKGNVTPFVGGYRVYREIEKQIKSAESSILIEMYDFADFELAELLVEQKNKGVDIKVLLDHANLEGSTTSEARSAVAYHLRQNHIPLLTFNSDRVKNQSDHCKLVIVDGKSVLLGGMNWNPASENNHDAAVKIEGPAVQYYSTHFAEGWNVSGGGMIMTDLPSDSFEMSGKSAVKGIRSDGSQDTSARHVILDSIGKAKESIYLEMYRLSDKDIIGNLIDAHHRGVDVRVILDPTDAKTGWNVNSKTFETLANAGVPVRWYDIMEKSTQRMHSKWAVIDGKETIIGSVNWSSKGLKENREIGALVQDKKTANVFMEQFLHDWNRKSNDMLSP